jgi:hypothetical protein
MTPVGTHVPTGRKRRRRIRQQVRIQDKKNRAALFCRWLVRRTR